MTVPFFQSGDHADYKTWENVLDKAFTDDIDTIVTHSMGGKIAIEYIIAHQKKLKRIVFVAPSLTSKTDEVRKLYDTLTQDVTVLKSYVDEIIVISSLDDIGREGMAKAFATSV